TAKINIHQPPLNAVITAYNGGAGSVLRVFHSDKKQAAQRINNLEPGEVYETLSTKHPAAESRNYLIKVNKAQKKYLGNEEHPLFNG
ncbi:hypothetical protein H3292_23385, partial [Providencia stuartii]|nr:hypothetical protein [Providencia stuartii]